MLNTLSNCGTGPEKYGSTAPRKGHYCQEGIPKTEDKRHLHCVIRQFWVFFLIHIGRKQKKLWSPVPGRETIFQALWYNKAMRLQYEGQYEIENLYILVSMTVCLKHFHSRVKINLICIIPDFNVS